VINYLVVAVIFLVIGTLLGMNISTDDGITETQLRTILNEALADVGTQTQTTTSFADDDPYLGPEDAPVTVVEFSDFLCPFCGRHFNQTLTPLMENYDGLVRYVYRDLPVIGGQISVNSALASECADDQGEFWPYHELLFENQDALNTDVSSLNNLLVGYAEELELDVEQFETCLEDQLHIGDIFTDMNVAQNNGATGTPAFFVNGQFISGAQPYEVFASLIDAELRAAGIEPPSRS
jgi:protein-disulfide isomerase